jgi:hypothetical protein
MHWLIQFLTREPRVGKSSLFYAVRFDTEDWTSAKRHRNLLEWRNAVEDTLCASVYGNLLNRVSRMPDRDSLRAFYREEAIINGGGIVCADIVQAGGVRAVIVINKYERRLRMHMTAN